MPPEDMSAIGENPLPSQMPPNQQSTENQQGTENSSSNQQNTQTEVEQSFDTIQSLVGDNKVETIATGLLFSEGPVWVPAGFLLFTDIQANTIYRWSEDSGVEPFRNPSERANGLTLLDGNKVVACEHRGRRVSIGGLNGNKSPLAETYQQKKLNSPNDCVAHSNGNVYFTDPTYGLGGLPGELGFRGVFRVNSQGQVTRLAADFSFNQPNGIAFSPDETKVYIADTPAGIIHVFDVNQTGDLVNRKEFSRVNYPDGIKVDRFGNVYVAGQPGIEVFNKQGQKMGTIQFPQQPANMAFGGENYDTLYVTARSRVYKLKVNTQGAQVLKENQENASSVQAPAL